MIALALCLDSQGKLDLECLGSVLPVTTGSEAPVPLKAELVTTQPLPFKGLVIMSFRQNTD